MFVFIFQTMTRTFHSFPQVIQKKCKTLKKNLLVAVEKYLQLWKFAIDFLNK